jgi:hypothetical protein
MLNPYLNRLMQEDYLATSSKLRIVKDAKPLLSEHYLVFATIEAESFADIEKEELSEFLSSVVPGCFKEDYLLVERGRSKSCTGGGLTHAHGHLVPAKYRGQITRHFSGMFGGLNQCENAQEALSSVPSMMPYLLITEPGKDAQLTTNPDGFGRHIVRRLLADLERG